MTSKEINIREKPKDMRLRRAVIYAVCALVLTLTILLDVFFVAEIFSSF